MRAVSRLPGSSDFGVLPSFYKVFVLELAQGLKLTVSRASAQLLGDQDCRDGHHSPQGTSAIEPRRSTSFLQNALFSLHS
jgi:hypothetical protein